jgi:hypothetical protein
MQKENQEESLSINISKEAPINSEHLKKSDSPTSAVDAKMNSIQKNDRTLKSREDLDQNPLTTVDKSAGADSKWESQKQTPKGPAQPEVKR